MRITFALGHELPFPPSRGGGVNALLDGLCRAFVAEGHTVTAYSPLLDGRPARECDGGITHIRFKGAARRKNDYLNALLGLPYIWAIRASLGRCEILSCHMLHAFVFSGCRAARAVTYTLHRDPKWFVSVYRGLNRVYTASEAVSAQTRQSAPALAAKVRTIHNCVDFRGYEMPAPVRHELLRFIFVGRFSQDKGVDVLIRAFVAAAKQDPRIQLSLVGPTLSSDGGDESLAARSRAYIAASGVADRIEIAPPIFDRARLDQRIRESDVVCLPSVRGETLNMSIIESMRLGKCALVSDLPANAPLLKNGLTGLFARAGDEADWTAKILHFAANRDQVEAFGRTAFTYGREAFSTEAIAREYIQDFEALIRKPSGVHPVQSVQPFPPIVDSPTPL
jgi:glycosyltransferase involved in cell wall biosynthesis